MEARGTTGNPGGPAGTSVSASASVSPGPPRWPTRAWTWPTWSRTTGRGGGGSWRWARGLPSPSTGGSTSDRAACRLRGRRRGAAAAPMVASLEADARRRDPGAGRAIHRFHRGDADLELFAGTAGRLSAEIFQEGLALQDVGGRAGHDHRPGHRADDLGIHGARRGHGAPAQPGAGPEGGDVLPGAPGNPPPPPRGGP